MCEQLNYTVVIEVKCNFSEFDTASFVYFSQEVVLAIEEPHDLK